MATFAAHEMQTGPQTWPRRVIYRSSRGVCAKPCEENEVKAKPWHVRHGSRSWLISAWLRTCRCEGVGHGSQGWHAGTQQQHTLESSHCHRGGLHLCNHKSVLRQTALMTRLEGFGQQAMQGQMPDIGFHPAIWIIPSSVDRGAAVFCIVTAPCRRGCPGRVDGTVQHSGGNPTAPACMCSGRLAGHTCMASASVASLSKRQTSHWAPLTNPRSLMSATNSPAQHACH